MPQSLFPPKPVANEAKLERDCWTKLKTQSKKRNWLTTRIENWAGQGFPDVVLCDPKGFFHLVELKNLNSGNKVNLSPHQVSFLTRHSHASVWLAVFRRRELFLYKGSSAVEVVENGLKAEPHVKLTIPADWNIFFTLLSHTNSE